MRRLQRWKWRGWKGATLHLHERLRRGREPNDGVVRTGACRTTSAQPSIETLWIGLSPRFLRPSSHLCQPERVLRVRAQWYVALSADQEDGELGTA